MPNRIHFLFLLILISVIFLVYYDSFNNLFLYDDLPFLTENPAVRNLDLNSAMSYFTDKDTVSSSRDLAKDVWRPFMTLSFAIDYKLWKLDARLYHIENTSLHAINAILVYILVALILGDSLAAFIAALIFAIHPVQTGAVTWVSGRSNMLFLLFFLSALIFHVKNRRSGVRALYYCLSLILFVFSLFSKEMAIVLPALLILYDMHFYPIASIRKVHGGAIKYYVKYYLPFFLIAAYYLSARFSALGTFAQQENRWGGDIFTNALMTLKALAGYIRLIVIPVNLRVEYLVDAPRAVFDRDVLAAIFVLALAAALYRILRRDKAASFWMLWFFLSLIPVYNIVPFKAVMAERFLYLPLIGFAAIAGMGLSKLYKDPKASFAMRAGTVAALASLLTFYGALSISRNIEWRDELSFYACEALRSPMNPKAHYNLGFIYARKAKAAERCDRKEAALYYMVAIEEFKNTLLLKPDSQIAYFGLGNAYNSMGKYGLAIKALRKAAALKGNADIYNNLAFAYYRNNMYDEAIASSRNALKIDPRHVNAWTNLGNAYSAKGEDGKAARALAMAAELKKEKR